MQIKNCVIVFFLFIKRKKSNKKSLKNSENNYIIVVNFFYWQRNQLVLLKLTAICPLLKIVFIKKIKNLLIENHLNMNNLYRNIILKLTKSKI